MPSDPFESLVVAENGETPPTATDPSSTAGDPTHPTSAAGAAGVLLPSVVREPIADGSQVLLHDGFDVEVWEEALHSFPKLRRSVAEARQRLVTADALLRDLFWSFHRRTVSTEPLVPLTAAYAVNRQVVEQVLSTIEWQQVRDAGTVGDLLTSAMATMTVVRRALDALDAETVARVNRLHELESGAAELFANAAALEDLAAQAEGDRAAALFDEARLAREQAEAEQTEAEALGQELLEESEAREDVVRRAARPGLQQVEEEIEAITAAVRAYTGGYAPGYGGAGTGGGRELATKEKLALATWVGRSRRLQQIAAICGRFTRIALEVQKTKVRHPPTEIAAIGMGRDLVDVLPSEFAALSDPALEDIFYYRYAMGQLLQYHLTGEEPQGQGPIIVALDNSGSMSDPCGRGGLTKELWSKGVTMALLAIARLQRRDLAVIHFSAERAPEQLSVHRFPQGQGGHAEVIACVDHFDNGGHTSFEPWMEQALRLVDEATFQRADVICVSDGLTTIAPQMVAEWQRRRQERGMRAYAVLIGTEQGAGVLGSIVDALLPLDDLERDTEVLETLFTV
jgi:uncharacterized protein with von Willebrand factor type A (vWA) domain